MVYLKTQRARLAPHVCFHTTFHTRYINNYYLSFACRAFSQDYEKYQNLQKVS